MTRKWKYIIFLVRAFQIIRLRCFFRNSNWGKQTPYIDSVIYHSRTGNAREREGKDLTGSGGGARHDPDFNLDFQRRAKRTDCLKKKERYA
jgi:hypothetical protein